MSQRRSRAPSASSSASSDPRLPPASHGARGRRNRDSDLRSPRRRKRPYSGRGYSLPRDKPVSSKIDLQLCVFHGAPSHRWRTAPFVFDRRRDDDRELWEELRHIYRDELQGVWRRIYSFKKLKKISPVEVHNCPLPLRCMRDLVPRGMMWNQGDMQDGASAQEDAGRATA